MADMNHPAVRTVQSLAVLLDLARRARQVRSVSALDFLLVNDSFQLAPYRQAVLWTDEEGVKTLSGVVQIEANAPYVQWLQGLCKHLLTTAQAGPVPEGPRTFDATDLPHDAAQEWAQWWPAHAVVLRIADPKGVQTGALLLARDQVWTADELRLLQEWTQSWAHARWALQGPGAAGWRGALGRLRRHFAKRTEQRWWQSNSLRWGVLLLAVCFIPVRLSVLAPAELVPARPLIVRAPMDAVVEQFHVQPNQLVKKDQPLLDFDQALIKSRVQVAEQSLATAQAQYRQTTQQALGDERSKAQLALLIGTVEEKRAEVNYLKEQMERSRLLAPSDGMVLFDDPSEWIGKPVSTGERILRIAAPDDREVEAWIPLADAIDLERDAPVWLYLAASPLDPVQASLRYLAHEATERPDGTHAYRVRASVQGQTGHRVGSKGTARLQGRWTVLGYWVLRRPLAALRSYLGM